MDIKNATNGLVKRIPSCFVWRDELQEWPIQKLIIKEWGGKIKERGVYFGICNLV